MATMEEMERDGKLAEAELAEKMKDAEFAKAARTIAGFIRKWYLKAGYKRLCKALLNATK